VQEAPVIALRPKRERFAQLYAAHGNATRAYREAFDCAPDIRPGTIKQRAYELVHEPAVAERVRQLLALAAEGTTISAKARMVRLQDIVEADPGELVRVVADPCAKCYPADDALAQAPREDCASCRGDGVSRLVITPTDQLSASARRLLKGIKRSSTGEIELRLHDQLTAADMLNRMQGSYAPDRSVALTARVDMNFTSMTREQQLAFLDSIRPAR
jgi:hypothetical protein